MYIHQKTEKEIRELRAIERVVELLDIIYDAQLEMRKLNQEIDDLGMPKSFKFHEDYINSLLKAKYYTND